MSILTTPAEATAAGRAAYNQGLVTLHDVGGYARRTGVPMHLFGAWLNGVEEASGFYDEDETKLAEDRALAGAWA